jgi:hypothetical protein
MISDEKNHHRYCVIFNNLLCQGYAEIEVFSIAMNSGNAFLVNREGNFSIP